MKTEIVTLTCDSPRHGDRLREAAVTRRLGLGRDEYETDLCEKDARQFDADMAPFLAAARVVKPQRREEPQRSAVSRRHKAEVRAWAKTRGLMVTDRGRLPVSVIAAFEKEHGHG